MDNTTLYIQLERTLFSVQSDESPLSNSQDSWRGEKLIEAGFEYVCEVNGVKLFKKRK